MEVGIMTDPLAPIRARAVAATPGPWEHFPITGKTNGLRIGGKAGYAELDPYDASFVANAREDVPALLAALDAVMALHHKSPIYDTWVEDCGHNFECDGVEGDDGYSYCPDSVSGYTCAECAELNKDNMDGELPDWPCPTVAAVSAALGGEA